MTSLTYDESQWPIVQLNIPPQPTRQDVDGLLTRLDSIFARQDPFAAVLTTNVSDDAPLKQDKEASKKMMQWIKEKKPLFTEYCQGIVYVIENAPGRYATMKVFSKVAGPRMYGCPINVTQSTEDAYAWATQQLQGKKA